MVSSNTPTTAFLLEFQLSSHRLRTVLPIASVHVINDIWKGDPSYLSWRDIVLLAHRLGSDQSFEAFDRSSLTWFLPYVEASVGMILELPVPVRPQPGTRARHDKLMRRRLDLVGWKTATAIGRHPAGWALRLPTGSALAYLAGSMIASPSYVRSKYGGYRAYWSLVIRSLKAALSGADFRREDVAYLTEQHERRFVIESAETPNEGPITDATGTSFRAQPNGEMVRTYVAFTPYHLILARAMQMSCGGALAHLVVADEVRICEIIPEIWIFQGCITSHGYEPLKVMARRCLRRSLA